MISNSYSFTRAKDNLHGFFSTQSAGTDAFNAISSWQNLEKGRSYNILLEEEEFLNAEISCNDDDMTAGKELDQQCFAHGVERRLLR
ncbi:MAG: hypothetical protein CVU60_17805 [Deltaproteobacteria bacterium HGW-Deltaproteobacteria-18]|jgi:hypothetical protein|nr:MAG: hypothetical protein CVU60_17805 [Deltaproteobacteria bacterium HGW-Deltaproteobacteria-18]